MRYCSHCGKQIADDVAVCMGCGVPVENADSIAVCETKPKRKVLYILIPILSVILIAAIIIGIIFIPKAIKVNKIEKALEGKTFTSFISTNYYYIENTYKKYKMEFKKDNKVHYTYYYSSIDSGGDYDKDYKIKINSDEILLILGNGGKGNEFIVELYDSDRVKSLTDTSDSDIVLK